ncbi:hypothetical protein [Variovorax sp. YR566]|uniref:hypothetical protein n=1 Tax=Variovorax sp. YR566 TaxID=3450237 RepID=UPI003F822D89
MIEARLCHERIAASPGISKGVVASRALPDRVRLRMPRRPRLAACVRADAEKYLLLVTLNLAACVGFAGSTTAS